MMKKDNEEEVSLTFDGQVAAQGSTTWEGQVTVVYDDTAGSAYELLLAEAESPTAAGYSVLFQPEGATSGDEEIQTLLIVGYPEVAATGGRE